jgi:cytochrome c oxidase cbb3-type subunit 3
MRFKRNYKKIPLSVVAGTLALSLHAQTTTDTAAPLSNHNNYAVILMVTVAFLLAFVIWGLSSVLMAYARKTLEKSRAASKILPLLFVIGFSLISYHSGAQDTTVATAKATQDYFGLSQVAFWLLASVISLEIIVIAFFMIMIKGFEKELLPQKGKAKAFNFNKWWARVDKKFFTKAIPVEREKDILLDHDYDGIHELDNPLPPWWKYGFYITIGIAIIYLLNYEVLGYGKNPTQEYNEEMANAKIQMEAYAAKSGNTIDENNIKMPDADGLTKGKEIFTTTCWPCHGKLGEGGVGPNLTDNYWLHKGSLNDIYQSIKHGYPDKGMQAWEKTFSAKEINDLAGYIKSLKGTNPPNSKAQQGDLFTEVVSSTDSLIVKQ